MLKFGVVAEPQDDRIVGLIGLRTLGGDKTFQQRRAGAVPNRQERTGICRGGGTRRRMYDMNGPDKRSAGRNRNQNAVRRHGCVQRHHRIGHRAVKQQIGSSLVRRILEHFVQWAHGDGCLERCDIR